MKVEKIFIPVKDDGVTAYPFRLEKHNTNVGYIATDIYVEERQGVIVFTPEELKELIYEYNLGELTLDQFLKEKGYV